MHSLLESLRAQMVGRFRAGRIARTVPTLCLRFTGDSPYLVTAAEASKPMTAKHDGGEVVAEATSGGVVTLKK